MRTSRVLVTIATIALIGVLGGIGVISAQRSGGSGTLTGSDIAEIERLYARYNQGLDFADEELYLSAWADDAVFTTGDGEKFIGKEGLRKRHRLKLGGEGVSTLHNNTSIVITPTDDGGARGRAYWIMLDTTQATPRMTIVGHYFDTFVRTKEGWRIKTRGSVRGWDWRLKKP